MARITLWGFYQFTDKKLFDNIKLYEGFDKQVLIDLIMQQSGELFPFHQQPEYLQLNIENWFSRMYEQFKRMYIAITADYNPIENYDRIEEWSDSESGSQSESESSSSSSSAHDSTSDSSSNSMTSDISAANMTGGFLPDSASNGVTEGRSSTDSNSRINSSRNRHDLSDRSYKHGGRIHGNIGVLTNQSMIESELRLRQFDIYETIANMFEEEFIIRLY